MRKKIYLLKGILDGESAYTGPFYIDVDVTPFCNLYCRGCQYHSSKIRKNSQGSSRYDHISMQVVDKICAALPELKTKEIFLCGQGEPLLHPRIGDIIKAFKKAHSKVQLFTNGTLIDPAMAKVLVDSGLDVVRASIWALDGEEYKQCYPGTDSENLQQALDGIRALHELKTRTGLRYPKIILTAPLNRFNFFNIESRIRRAHELGCDGLWFDIYNHWGEFSRESLTTDESELLCRKLLKLRPVIRSFYMTHNIEGFVARYRRGEQAWRAYSCYAGWFHCRIQNNGWVLPCGSCRVALGDLNKNTLTEIWHGPRYQAFRKTALLSNHKTPGSYECDCDWCCLGQSNIKVERIFKWIRPFVRIKAATPENTHD